MFRERGISNRQAQGVRRSGGGVRRFASAAQYEGVLSWPWSQMKKAGVGHANNQEGQLDRAQVDDVGTLRSRSGVASCGIECWDGIFGGRFPAKYGEYSGLGSSNGDDHAQGRRTGHLVLGNAVISFADITILRARFVAGGPRLGSE